MCMAQAEMSKLRPRDGEPLSCVRAAGLGYDPYNPELPKPPVQRENGALGRGDEPRSDILELELVNQAIEAVRSEVELEQRRYQELLETAREHSSAEAPAVAPRGPAACPAAGLDEDAFPLSFDYNPGGRPGLLNPDASYQPTPLAAAAEAGSKYSLASLDRVQGHGGGGGSTLEYVPKAVSQPQRYGRPVPSSKYVLDDSKPSTDLEYDPLSNFSARLLSRASSKDDRAPKRPRGSRGSEPYTPALKKPCDPFAGCDARFSDSDDDAAAALPDVPVTTSPPRSQAGPESKAPGQPASRESQDAEEGGLRETKEMAVQYDVGDLGQSPKAPGGTPVAKPSSPARASREPGSSKQGRPKKKKSGALPAPGPKDGIQKKDRGKDGEHGRPAGKPCADRRGPQAGSPRHKAEQPEGTKKKPSSATPVASSGKSQPDRGSVHQLPNRPGGKTVSGKLAERKARSLDEGASRDAPKLQKRALSHADLFGDESEDEGPGPAAPPAAPPHLSSTSDSDSDSDSSLGYSAAQGPRKRLKAPLPARPAPASPSSCSSSSSSSSSGVGGGVDYAALEKEVDFDSDPMEECLRIFNESTSVKTEDRGRLARQPPKEEKIEDKGHSGLTTLFPGQKRRISHLSKQGKEAEPVRRGPAPPARPPTAQEVCYRRAQQAQRDSAPWLQATQPPAEKPSSIHISAPGEKRRIAHVPNPRLAAAPTGAKRALAASSSQPPNGPEPGSQPLKARTLSGMASKTTTTVTPKRVAHSPSLQSLKKPVIPKEFGGKVPTVIRQRYLNLFIEECLKFCSSNQEAIEKALNEEKVAYDRSPSKNIYLNVAVNTLKKLRGLVPSSAPGLNKSGGRRVVSHEMVLGGKLATKTSFSLSRPSSPRVGDLKGAALYGCLKEYLLTEDQLKENGYPFPHPERPGGAVIFTAEEKRPKDSSCRVCCRCGAEYLVAPSGRCAREEECCYHWGRLRRNRVAGGWETQYTCCSAAIGSTGCQVAKQHVQDGRKENLEGFVKTFDKELPEDAHPGIFALDCEMSYTTYGLELTRVTVVDTDMQVVYDTFVKPDNEIVDYNTRFSGVTEADLADTSISLRDVQAVLLSMFSADTVLIGHSLESDLLALKVLPAPGLRLPRVLGPGALGRVGGGAGVGWSAPGHLPALAPWGPGPCGLCPAARPQVIHSTVVDTSVLFPHRLGLPYKRSLRNLMADYLRQIIQDNVDGHSSSEDASACMHLVIWKIREDAKTKR
ncbi:RNA exonuclease 1 homolog isoform X2 [Zalophus californianus]|uniref:RNA exonuclease 1 homolog isoform X2 n=2 Tax=Zalophus californianus TaxID=9704 RepID=A0A6J2C1H3_ZALCA|nr:RNA exonuclease 1 homolog isoform X2 [Zalophus californianus]XP_027438036.2 RNA exonuclease 1 homolog isoform X2 [Zalophus californianus]XP_027438037.2 RNA exonuclease 1 homolog isoform X2 [Zalophus californianus]XP_027438038.2 RNA exonuclease 1 homolog isoform X2 [Zalophus californianus]